MTISWWKSDCRVCRELCFRTCIYILYGVSSGLITLAEQLDPYQLKTTLFEAILILSIFRKSNFCGEYFLIVDNKFSTYSPFSKNHLFLQSLLIRACHLFHWANVFHFYYECLAFPIVKEWALLPGCWQRVLVYFCLKATFLYSEDSAFPGW